MRDKDGIILESLYGKVIEKSHSKVLVKEEYGKFLEIGYTSNPLPDTVSFEMNGQRYIVSGLVDVTPDVTSTDDEFQYIQGYGKVRTYEGGDYAEDDPNIKIINISIQIPEMVKVKDSVGRETEEEKTVYDVWEGKLKINELEDKPDVIEAAKEALINKALEYYNKNPDEFI